MNRDPLPAGAATKVIAGKSGLSGSRDPAFSPDGKKLAFEAHDGNYWEVYTVPVTGGTPTNWGPWVVGSVFHSGRDQEYSQEPQVQPELLGQH